MIYARIIMVALFVLLLVYYADVVYTILKNERKTNIYKLVIPFYYWIYE